MFVNALNPNNYSVNSYKKKYTTPSHTYPRSLLTRQQTPYYPHLLSFKAQNTSIERDKHGLLTSQIVNDILKNSIDLHYSVDTSDFSPNEKRAIAKMVEAGRLIQDVFMNQDFPNGKELYDNLKQLAEQGDRRAKDNLKLFEAVDRRAFTHINRANDTHDNKFPIWDVGITRHDGGTLYPSDFQYSNNDIRDNLKIAQGFKADDLLSAYTVIKKASKDNIQADLQKIKEFPEILPYHYQFNENLKKLTPNETAYYATPYAVEYAKNLIPAAQKLREGGAYIAQEDIKLADYMFSLANAFISNNYFESDVKWMDVDGKLDLSMGPLENYYDLANKNKTFFQGDILKKDDKVSKKFALLSQYAQDLENALPIDDQYKKDMSGTALPIYAYNVLQRSGKSHYFLHVAEILPNDPVVAATKGRKTMLFLNNLTSPLEQIKFKQISQTLIHPTDRPYVSLQSSIDQVACHELSHALGPEYTAKNSTLTVQKALGEYEKIFEELKADSLAYYSANILQEKGFYTQEDVKRLLVTTTTRDLANMFKPSKGQDYAIMRLIKFNYLKEHGVITLDPETRQLTFNFDNYKDVTKNLVKHVLDIQLLGNSDHYKTLKSFLEKYTVWSEDNKYIAEKIKEIKLPNYVHQEYTAIDKIMKEYGEDSGQTSENFSDND